MPVRTHGVRLGLALLFMLGSPTVYATDPAGALDLSVAIDEGASVPALVVFLEREDGELVVSGIPDAAGRIHFAGLPPGTYWIELVGGDGCRVQQGFSIEAGKTVAAALGLPSCADVTDSLEGGDPASVQNSRGTVLTREFLQRAPSGRSYQTATQMAAGVTVGPPRGNPNIGGASLATPTIGGAGYDEVGSRERFTDHGVTPAALVERDSLSTFSIDVDTASFALARSSLTASVLPDPASVRVEEFVNTQHYSDPAPDGEAPFAASLELAPDPVRPGHHALRIGLRAADSPVDRAPLALTFLVDVSGSMSGPGRLDLAQASLHELVEHLRPDDRVALVTYAGRTAVVLEPTAVASAARIHRAIDSLRSGGSTAMGSGMELAYELASRSALRGGGENRVIVLSDGDANIGATSHESILDAIRHQASEGITLTTVGFGRGNYQDTLMEQLADQGDGNYHYIDTMSEARRVFGRDLAGTLVTVARDVKVQVDFDPASVLSYRLVGYENRDIADTDFREDDVDAGEMGSGHTVTAVYDLVLRDDPGDTLAVLRVRSKPPGIDAPATERAVPLPTGAARETFASASPDFRIAWCTAAFAELLRHSPHVEELTYREVAELASAARRNPDDDALIALIRRAQALEDDAERRTASWRAR